MTTNRIITPTRRKKLIVCSKAFLMEIFHACIQKPRSGAVVFVNLKHGKSFCGADRNKKSESGGYP